MTVNDSELTRPNPKKFSFNQTEVMKCTDLPKIWISTQIFRFSDMFKNKLSDISMVNPAWTWNGRLDFQLEVGTSAFLVWSQRSRLTIYDFWSYNIGQSFSIRLNSHGTRWLFLTVPSIFSPKQSFIKFFTRTKMPSVRIESATVGSESI